MVVMSDASILSVSRVPICDGTKEIVPTDILGLQMS